MAAALQQSVLDTAQTLYDEKVAEAEQVYKDQVAKIEALYKKQCDAANEKYDAFVAQVEEDTNKRLKIVNKVIDAESEERRWKEDQAERAARAEAERKLAEDAEKARQAEEERLKKIEEKKKAKAAAKARKKMLAERAKFPIPPGFVSVSDSKKLKGKLKKLAGAGRYAFCVFYNAKSDKKFKAFCEELSGEFNENVAWFDCAIKDMNFEDAMLLYEFNATPAVVICREGKPSNLHRYIIGDNDDNRDTLRNYAEKADND